MSFLGKAWNLTKNIGAAVVNEIDATANEVKQLTEKYEKLSDDELLKIVGSDGVFGKSRREKGVAAGILRKRGHDISVKE
ncbi:hypothetical protein CLV44_13219 [Marinobacterium halophilum]|uniref:Uncharacterized protein n=1 Tax=Marinobacterium halophilum TaxID=267374 RepID=A0A2P8EIU8_9GAMM|nr:hypothetical protein [Marinobacterium halophilum]PSL09395.1 hypothetical protein CLV44_13219 [Marinobacterium halophilum]